MRAVVRKRVRFWPKKDQALPARGNSSAQLPFCFMGCLRGSSMADLQLHLKVTRVPAKALLAAARGCRRAPLARGRVLKAWGRDALLLTSNRRRSRSSTICRHNHGLKGGHYEHSKQNTVDGTSQSDTQDTRRGVPRSACNRGCERAAMATGHSRTSRLEEPRDNAAAYRRQCHRA